MKTDQHPLFKRYQHIRQFLKANDYRLYCDWDNFRSFREDIEQHLGLPPGPGYYLHRLKPERGWRIGNLEWARRPKMLLDCKWTKTLRYRNRTWTLRDFADEFDLTYNQVYNKYRQNWGAQDILKHYGRI